jgi:hypothetical protein
MPTRLTPTQLDEILALQLTIAWSGESAGDPPRLGWWKTDLVDPEGGGDLFSRLVPKTAAWASLILVRNAARSVDAAARKQLATGDTVLSLFHFGFSVDEALDDRLVYHRQHRHEPSVLGPRLWVSGAWSKAKLEERLGALGKPKWEEVPYGRKVAAGGASAPEAAVLLAASLLPLGSAYPLPYIEVTG